MPNITFDAFIEEQTASCTAEQKVDWDQRREQWRQHLGRLYELVENYMRQYVAQGKVRVRRGTKMLHEEFVGSYSVDTMALEIGANSIEFDPVGTNLIGAQGRVDMRSAKGTVKFVLVPADAAAIGVSFRVVEGEHPVKKPREPVENWTWKIATPPPRVSCMELCKESFQDAIMEVVNG